MPSARSFVRERLGHAFPSLQPLLPESEEVLGTIVGWMDSGDI